MKKSESRNKKEMREVKKSTKMQGDYVMSGKKNDLK